MNKDIPVKIFRGNNGSSLKTNKVAKNKSVSQFLLLASETPFNKMNTEKLNKISLTEAKTMYEIPLTHQTKYITFKI